MQNIKLFRDMMTNNLVHRFVTIITMLFPCRFFFPKATITFAIIFFQMLYFGLFSSLSAQQNKTDSLFSVLQETKSDTNRAMLLYKIANEYLFVEPIKTIKYATLGVTISEKNGYKKGKSLCLNALGRAYLNTGKYDMALICFEKRYEIVKELKDSIEIARVYINMGIIYKYLCNYEKAIELNQKAIRILNAYNEKSLLAKVYINMGTIYQPQAEYSLAMDYYLKACKIYEEEKNEQDIGLPLMNVSLIYTELKQFDKAKQYAFEAYSSYSKSNNLKRIGEVFQILAAIYSREGNNENSIKYYKKAKTVFENIQDEYYLGIVNQGLGTVYLELKDYKTALDYYIKALALGNKIEDRRLISVLYENIGEVYTYLGDFPKALNYTRKSEKNLLEINDKLSLLEVVENYIIVFSEINQPDSVRKYIQKYKQLSNIIYNENNNKSISEMQTKYETEKKDKEILTLNLEAQKKKNTVWAVSSGALLLLMVSLSGFAVFSNKKKKEQAILQQQITEHDLKALRAQMNPHFIFNCIHTIERLLDEMKIKESKDCLLKFSSLTRSVLENSVKREISLADEIKALSLYMDLENRRFHHPFSYRFEIDQEIDQEATMIAPLILQPFVENSIKHGFRNPEKPGQLKIVINREGESLVCMVEDNGVGRETGKNGIHLSGFKKESMGIKLTEDRLKLINGLKNTTSRIIIEDLVDMHNTPLGTRVQLFLPFEQSA